jgi:hypothetical protein
MILFLSACVTQNIEMAGKVNGKPIPYNEFMAEFRNRYEAFSIQNNRPPSSDEKELLIAETWQNITKDVVLKQHFKKYNITATMQEAIDTLKANPPAYIKTSPLFTVNGRFDQSSYHQSLDYDRPENLMMLKRQYQTYYVPIARLKNKLIEREMLSKSQMKRVDSIVSGDADIDWVILDSRQLDAVVTDTEATEYYQANKQRWVLEPRFSLAYAVLPVQASQSDSLYAKALIDSLVAASTDPKSLHDFITSHTMVKTNDSGYVFLMDLDSNLKTTLSNVQEGEFSNAELISGSWQVLRLDQMTKSMLKFTSFTIPIQAGQQSAAAFLPKARQLRDLASQLGIVRAAEEMDLRHRSHQDLLPSDRWIDDPAIVSMVSSVLDSASDGYLFEPRYHAPLSAWIVVQLIDNQNQRFMPFQDTKASITAILRATRQKEIALRNAQDWLSTKPRAATDSKTIPGSRTVSQQKVNVNSLLDGFPLRDIYFNAVQLHITKQPVQAYAAGDLVIIPFIRAFRPGDARSISPQVMREYYAISLGPNWFNAWLDAQVKNANVRIIAPPPGQ